MFYARTAHIKCMFMMLVAACASLAAYERCLGGKPGGKPAGLSQNATSSCVGQFLRNTLVLPLGLWQNWLPGWLWSQHLAGSDREGIKSFHASFPPP